MNPRTFFNPRLLSLVLISFLLSSCLKEYKNVDKISKTTDYYPSMAIAVAKGKLTVRDIVQDYDLDELFQETSDGSLFLNYSKRTFTKNAQDLIKIPNQNFPTVDICNKNIYDAISPEDGYRTLPTIGIPNVFLLTNDESLNFIYFDTLDLVVTINSSFELAGDLKINFPGLKVDNQTVKVEIEIDNSGSFHYVYTQRLLDGELDFTEANTIIADLDLRLADGVAGSNDALDFTLEMNNLDFHAVYGYVGRINVEVPRDTVNILAFNTAFSGKVWFQDPSIGLHVVNSFGVPVRNYFGDLETYSVLDSCATSGTWTSHAFPYEYIDLPYATAVGETQEESFIFNYSNFPALSTLMSDCPKYLSFNVDSVVVNQGGYEASAPNFVIDTSKMTIDIDMKLPLKGNAWYSLVDTLEMDIERSFGDISEQFSEMNFRAVLDNALPTNVYCQLIFLDSLSLPIDTLFEGGFEGNRLLNASNLDSNGKVVEPTQTVVDILFGDGLSYNHNMNDIENVRRVIVIATLKTNEAGVVGEKEPIANFYGDNYLGVSFGVRGIARINSPQ